MNWTVYWIHWTDNDDPLSQGYVGVTNNTSRRWRKHQKTENWRLHKCISTGGVMSVLHEGLTEAQALALEEEMRPEEHIGLNIARGGGLPAWRVARESNLKSWKENREARCEALRKAGAEPELRKMRSESAKRQHAEGKFGKSKKGFKYPRVDCPDCGESVAKNCLTRHVCRERTVCAREGCDNPTKTKWTTYCSLSCGTLGHHATKGMRK